MYLGGRGAGWPLRGSRIGRRRVAQDGDGTRRRQEARDGEAEATEQVDFSTRCEDDLPLSGIWVPAPWNCLGGVGIGEDRVFELKIVHILG